MFRVCIKASVHIQLHINILIFYSHDESNKASANNNDGNDSQKTPSRWASLTNDKDSRLGRYSRNSSRFEEEQDWSKPIRKNEMIEKLVLFFYIIILNIMIEIFF